MSGSKKVLCLKEWYFKGIGLLLLRGSNILHNTTIPFAYVGLTSMGLGRFE